MKYERNVGHPHVSSSTMSFFVSGQVYLDVRRKIVYTINHTIDIEQAIWVKVNTNNNGRVA